MSAPTLQPIPVGAANTVAITANVSTSGSTNTLLTAVTLCVPGTQKCQTVDNVIVDTGSTGLRLMAPALGSLASALPVERFMNGNALGACGQFISAYTWGTMVTADVKMGGEVGYAVPIQVIGDARVPTAPSSCSAAGAALNTPAQLGANGVLGLAHAVLDCGSGCASQAINGAYYSCTETGCSASAVPLTMQAINPVNRFAMDNNGVVIQLPPVSATGTALAHGTLVFGIGTRENNALDAASVVMPIFANGNESGSGDLTMTIAGSGVGSVPGYLDTGSNAIFYQDGNLAHCTDTLAQLYCPSVLTARSMRLMAANGKQASTGFSVANAQSLLRAGANVSNDFAAGTTGLALFGLPFFYGRHVALAMDGSTTVAGIGPFVAF